MTTAASETRAENVCPLCGADAVRRFAKHEIHIADCESCGHRFADIRPGEDHVAEHYDDEYFTGGGAGYSDYVAEADLLQSHGRRYAQLLRRYCEPGKMVDVGAAAGFILKGFVDEGWQGVGVEPNATMAGYARDELGLDVRTGTLDDLDEDSQFDLITMIQVVAHIPDPSETMQSVHRLLRPGGHCLIETWDWRSLTARLFGRNWHEYSPPTVLHWFSAASLSQQMRKRDFETVAKGRPAKYLNGEHAKSLLRYKLGDSSVGRLCSKLLNVVPDGLKLRYPAEDLFWALFRRTER